MPTDEPQKPATSVSPAPASSEVPSPCILVCTMQPDTGYCMGCLRTLDEITHWATMTNEQKQAVLDQLDERFDASSGQ